MYKIRNPRVGPNNLWFNKRSRGCWCMLKTEDHCSNPLIFKDQRYHEDSGETPREGKGLE